MNVGVRMAGFCRKQILLRREDGTPAGFLRFEVDGEACRAELNADARDVRAVLLYPDAPPCQLGHFTRGKGSVSLRAKDVSGAALVAVLAGDKLLLTGGEGADFSAIRRQLAKPAKPAPRKERERKQETAAASAPAVAIDRALRNPAHPLAREGWAIAARRDAGLPERISGELMRDGETVARLHGVAGSYDVEPPPGLPGFHFEAGYWIREWCEE